MDIGMMNTTRPAASAAALITRTDTPQPAPPETASDYSPPSLVERMPQTSPLSMLPASSADALAPCATLPQLQPATELLNLPNELLRHLTSFLRTANTIPAIRDVARFRAACKDLHQGITAPIPDGMMGLVDAGAGFYQDRGQFRMSQISSRHQRRQTFILQFEVPDRHQFPGAVHFLCYIFP